MVWVQSKVRPGAPRRAPKIIKNCFLVVLEGQIHVFSRFFDGRHCGFERSLGALGALRGVLGGPGSSRVGFGRARGGPREEVTAFDGSKEGSGNRLWRSQGECICAKHTYLQRFLMIFKNYVFFNVRFWGRWG